MISLLMPPSEFYQDSVISAEKAQLRSKAELQVTCVVVFCLLVLCHLAIRLVAHEKLKKKFVSSAIKHNGAFTGHLWDKCSWVGLYWSLM